MRYRSMVRTIFWGLGRPITTHRMRFAVWMIPAINRRPRGMTRYKRLRPLVAQRYTGKPHPLRYSHILDD